MSKRSHVKLFVFYFEKISNRKSYEVFMKGYVDKENNVNIYSYTVLPIRLLYMW
jgi:hypothetical protein